MLFPLRYICCVSLYPASVHCNVMRDKFIISDVFKLAMTVIKYILSEAINIFSIIKWRYT